MLNPEHQQILLKQKRKVFHCTPTGRLAQAVPESEALLDLAFADGESAGSQTSQLLKLLDLYGAPALGLAIREALERGTPRASYVAFLLRKRQRKLRFMVPIPSVNSWAELNTYLAGQCRKRRDRRLRGHTEAIGERFERDRAAMLPLPAAPYEACEKVSTRVTSLSLVRYRTNDCGGPGCSDSFRRFLSGRSVFRFMLPEVLAGG